MDKQLFLVVFGKWFPPIHFNMLKIFNPWGGGILLLSRVKLLLFRVDMDGIRSVHYEAHLKGENASWPMLKIPQVFSHPGIWFYLNPSEKNKYFNPYLIDNMADIVVFLTQKVSNLPLFLHVLLQWFCVGSFLTWFKNRPHRRKRGGGGIFEN